MATQEDVLLVKRNTDNGGGWTDADISAALDSGLSVRAVTHQIWTSVAANSATLVDVSEAGSSRKLSDLHKNALAMAKHWDPVVEVTELSSRPTTRRITR